MSILIFAILIVVVGYFWFQSSPLVQYIRGISLLNKKRIIEAIPIFEDLFDTYPDAPTKLAECKLQQGFEYAQYDKLIAKSFFEQVIQIKKTLPAKANGKHFEKMETLAYLEIAKINFNIVNSEKPSQNKSYRIHENLKYIENAPHKGFEAEFYNLSQKHIFELTKLYYFIGTNHERESNYVEAIQSYSKIINLVNIPLNESIRANAVARTIICKLKNKEEIEENLLKEIKNASEDIKIDLYFRYVKNLIKEKKYDEAESLIQNHLNIDSPIIEKLKKIIVVTKKETVVAKINQINSALDKFYENDFTMSDLKDFYENLDIEINDIKAVVPNITEKIDQLKPSLFNRLLTNYIDEKKFANAINIIQKYPFFWENPELLKNLGICCYGYITQGHIDEKNYKIIISYYLTVIYSDKAIMKSLEQISRDDNYTYTLIESIGSTHKYRGTLPPNVNYDAVSETNISIGATQKELLNQFESLLLQKTKDHDLINIVQSFFSSEKEAIERLVNSIDKDILFASPHFAKTFNLNESLVAHLDEIYKNSRNEDVLEAGVPYSKGNLNSTYISEYALLKEMVYKVIKAVQKEDLIELKSIRSEENTTLIKKYNKLAAKTEDFLLNSIDSKINNNYDNDNLIPLMEEVIEFSSKNEKLKHQYSNYIVNYCINKVNAGKISNKKALSLTKTSYLYSSDNPQICRNFVTFIKLNLMDILNDRTRQTSEIYDLLDEIYLIRSNTFKQESAELSKIRTTILNELSKKGVDLSLFGEGRISSRVEEKGLNAQGEKMKKVLSYLKKMSEI
jgi:hypothetical protein